MKKAKIGGLVLVLVILVGLFVFAGTKKFEDSHLRVEGIRVKLDDYALMVEGCDEATKTAAYCKEVLEVDGQKQELEFKFINFKESGYPKTLVGLLNGKEIIRQDDIDLEVNGSGDYQAFLNINVIDNKYISFTHTKGTTGKNTTLYVVDLDGNFILNEHEIDDDNMLIKDYVEFLTYEEDNSIKILATRLDNDINYHGESVCKAKDKTVVEAYYTYTYKNGKFTKKQTETTTAKEFIEANKVKCTNE